MARPNSPVRREGLRWGRRLCASWWEGKVYVSERERVCERERVRERERERERVGVCVRVRVCVLVCVGLRVHVVV